MVVGKHISISSPYINVRLSRYIVWSLYPPTTFQSHSHFPSLRYSNSSVDLNVYLLHQNFVVWIDLAIFIFVKVFMDNDEHFLGFCCQANLGNQFKYVRLAVRKEWIDNLNSINILYRGYPAKRALSAMRTIDMCLVQLSWHSFVSK